MFELAPFIILALGTFCVLGRDITVEIRARTDHEQH